MWDYIDMTFLWFLVWFVKFNYMWGLGYEWEIPTCEYKKSIDICVEYNFVQDMGETGEIPICDVIFDIYV